MIKINGYGSGLPIVYGACVCFGMVYVALIVTVPMHAYGEANCPGSDDMVEFTAPPREGFAQANGTACVWYGYESEALDKPVIVMDGLDPGDVRDHIQIYDLLGENTTSLLWAEGYDLVILNFDQGAGHIQDNAHVLMDLLRWAKEESAYEAVVVGTSMGGLISRYALAHMESVEEDHNVHLFVSFDAPHMGANVPLANQYFVKFASDIHDLPKQYLEEELYSVAVRQMLLYHELSSPGAVGLMNGVYNETIYIDDPGPDALFVELQNELDMLGWPNDLRKVAISSGDGYGMNQGFEAGAQLIGYELDSPLLDIVANSYSIREDEMYHLLFEGKIDPFGAADYRFNVYIQNAIPYDNAPGGWLTSSKSLEVDAGCLYIAGVCAILLGETMAYVEHENNVPTHSAFGIRLSDLDNDPFADIDAAYEADHTITPFDMIYYPDGNLDHIEVNAENMRWFLCEVFGDNPDAYDRHCVDT